MMVQRRVMSWRRVAKALQAAVAHGLLFCFTLSLALKLDHVVSRSWWTIFTPLWLFHVVLARGRFSLPAPSMPHDRRWAPFHAVMAMPLLVAFELLLCIYLESSYAISLKIAFLPLLAFEVAILIDNVTMCRALMPGDEEIMSDEAIWETLPHFWVAISMVFLIAATAFTLLKLCGDVTALGWWDLFINYGIAECFAFLICTKWYNPAIHRHSHLRDVGSSSTTIRYLDWNSGLMVSMDEDQQQGRICSLQDIGGHIMKIPFIGFQILLFMRLEGTPLRARQVPISVIFSPLLLLQGVGVLFAIYRFIEKIVLLLHSGAGTERYFRISLRVRDCFGFMFHGSRLLGWWSIDEGSQKEQAQLYYDGASGYNTFSPDIVKKMPKSDLAEEVQDPRTGQTIGIGRKTGCLFELINLHLPSSASTPPQHVASTTLMIFGILDQGMFLLVWRLQAALCEQREITKFSQQEYERLQNEKVLCRVCFEEQINVVLLPCRHHILCSTCCQKCKRCPICRVSIGERLPVYDV